MSKPLPIKTGGVLAASIRIGNAGYFGAIRVISTRDHRATNERARADSGHIA